MSVSAPARPAAQPLVDVRRRPVTVLLVATAVLAVSVVLSLMVGAKALSPVDVLRELFAPTAGEVHDIVLGLRLDRTLIALVVGAALGGAGALMQALTRNPLADPGLLGVNAGAAAAVVASIAFFDVTDANLQIWWAFAGAAIASVAVYVLGSGGRATASPVRLALAGAALTAVLTAFISGVSLASQSSYDAMRFWLVGSVVGRELSVLVMTLPFIAVGAAAALLLTPALNAMALGADTGRALGLNVGRLRVLTAVAITLLCGAATAVAGPITFLGLVVPHVARRLVGPDQRWVVPLSMLLSASLLVLADVAGRVVSDGEIAAGIMCAFVGAPVFIFLVRRRRLAHL